MRRKKWIKWELVRTINHHFLGYVMPTKQISVFVSNFSGKLSFEAFLMSEEVVTALSLLHRWPPPNRMNKSWPFSKQPISYPWHWNLSSDNKATMACLLLLISFINLQNVVLAQDPDLTINGGWSPWSTVATPCMRPNARGRLEEVFCGGGMKTRKRSCTNPVPQVSLLTSTSVRRVKSFGTV